MALRVRDIFGQVYLTHGQLPIHDYPHNPASLFTQWTDIALRLYALSGVLCYGAGVPLQGHSRSWLPRRLCRKAGTSESFCAGFGGKRARGNRLGSVRVEVGVLDQIKSQIFWTYRPLDKCI